MATYSQNATHKDIQTLYTQTFLWVSIWNIFVATKRHQSGSTSEKFESALCLIEIYKLMLTTTHIEAKMEYTAVRWNLCHPPCNL